MPRYLLLVVVLSASFSSTIALAMDGAPVSVITASMGPVVENLPLTGTVTSEHVTDLSAQISGLVKQVNVDAGDRIHSGDTLVQLDDSQAKLSLDVAKAELNQAQVALNESKRLQREAQQLAKSKNIPLTTVDARNADVLDKAAALETLQAQLRLRQDIIQKHTIKAPFDGVVSRKLTEMGEWTQPGTPLLELVATDKLRLDVQMPQNNFSQIDHKTPVHVELDNGDSLGANISTIVPVNKPDTRTFLVRLQVDNNNRLIPGMSATAIFSIKLDQQAMLLPRDAIVQHPDGRSSVWIVEKQGDNLIAREIQVQLGRSLSNQVIIRSGLDIGRQVVVRGNETLRDGQPVSIIDSPSIQNDR